MSLVPRQALIARPPGGGGLPAAWTYLGDLFRTLFSTFAAHATAINSVADRGVTVPLPLLSASATSLPAAAGNTGALIYVSDEAGGAVPAFSDGTDWRRVTDRNVIAA